MWWIFLAGTMFVPSLMMWIVHQFQGMRFWFAIVASVSLILLSVQFAHALYQVIQANELFMTTIHGIFNDPVVQITGAYLGLYAIYLLHQQAASYIFKN